MSVTTKTGDKGITSLYMGGKVAKDDARVEAYGVLDELCSFLGLAKSFIKSKKCKKLIEFIQKDLFIICAELAIKVQFVHKLKRRIGVNEVDRLEIMIKELEGKSISKMRNFCLPGENVVSGTLDVARTIARKAERRVVTLNRKGMLRNKQIIIYLNRLSDLLYLLARFCEKRR